MNLTKVSILKIITDAYQAGQCNAGMDPSYSLAVGWHNAYQITEDSQWQPIETAIREAKERFMVCTENGYVYETTQAKIQQDFLEGYKPILWQPLPEQPKCPKQTTA